MNNLQILGTSHIARQSVQEIKKTVEEFKPDIVAVELDIQRAKGLLQNVKRSASLSDILKIGVKGFVFVKLGQFIQQKLGKVVGISPGEDMKTAMIEAREHKLELALIDQPIEITLKRFSKQLTWKEKWRFVVDIVKGIIMPKKQMKEMGFAQFDLAKVPQEKVIITMMSHLKRRFPSVYNTLVEERNKYMVRKLVKLMRAKPEAKILAVVGAGHKKGMEELLLRVDIIK